MSLIAQKTGGVAAIGGQVSFGVIKQRSAHELPERPLMRRFSVADIWKYAMPFQEASPYPEIQKEVNAFRRANAVRVWSAAHKIVAVNALKISAIQSALWLDIIRKDGRVIPLGLAGLKLVTDVGVGYIVDAFQNSVELENMKFHGLGTGSTAENATDTALVTELTTEYTGNVRATGTTTEGASANIYRTVATNTLDGTPGAALREHGLFSANAVGVLFDRTVYAAINLVSGDGLQSTYDGTFSSGG